MFGKNIKNQWLSNLIVPLLITPLVALLAIKGTSYYQQIKNDEMIINTLALDIKKHIDNYHIENKSYPKTLEISTSSLLKVFL